MTVVWEGLEGVSETSFDLYGQLTLRFIWSHFVTSAMNGDPCCRRRRGRKDRRKVKSDRSSLYCCTSKLLYIQANRETTKSAMHSLRSAMGSKHSSESGSATVFVYYPRHCMSKFKFRPEQPHSSFPCPRFHAFSVPCVALEQCPPLVRRRCSFSCCEDMSSDASEYLGLGR
jgi:hypothetical protein